jgi:AAA+ ATPase superfamily predicted ATPase
MKDELIGRETEYAHLHRLYESDEAEFIALYGRRRVGKTFLVRKSFEDTGAIYFELMGQKKASLANQLANFTKALQKCFYPSLKLISPSTWSDAFDMLTDAINKSNLDKKIVIFLDELPWLAGRKSELIAALDYIWNTEWVKNNRIKLIVCGSAASWIIKNIISDRGGLHNRVTSTLLLKPFNLSETKVFLHSRNVNLNLDQILQIYMVTGGVPYYLKAILPGLSAVENISTLCFQESALLFNEFDKLFDSLFDNAEIYIEIIISISSKRYGMNKSEILSKTRLSSSGGRFNQRLNELEEAGFIKKIIQSDGSGRKLKRIEYYRLIDEYCMFYLSWILPAKKQINLDQANHYWELQVQTSSWQAWAGYTFETICFKHVNNIINKLGISHLVVNAYPWRYIPNKKEHPSQTTGAQIDLILRRHDSSVTLCEIKYNKDPLMISKSLAESLLAKARIYQDRNNSRDHVFIVMVTNAGVQQNNYSSEVLANIVVLEDLFG